jgi:hypothetical protein
VSDGKDAAIARFLEAEKVISKRLRWRAGDRADYAEASSGLFDLERGLRFSAKLIITSHRARTPHKFSACLIFKGERVLALDANPGCRHRNILTRESVQGTHWHRWPNIEHAEADPRELGFRQWLSEFLTAAKVISHYRISSPPVGIQLELLK